MTPASEETRMVVGAAGLARARPYLRARSYARALKRAVRRRVLPDDIRRDAADVIDACAPYTMTSWERLYSMVLATRYVVRRGLDGAIVECGVWKGGSAMASALTLLALGSTDRTIYLYDTFSGMVEPSAHDVDHEGRPARARWEQLRQGDRSDWCYAPLEEVRHNLLSTGYPEERVVLVPGRVEDTIPATVPDRIALLRLDTDWYESTRHEMRHLYPRLVTGGVLIADDYGHWHGHRMAIEEELEELGHELLFMRIDESGNLAVKT